MSLAENHPRAWDWRPRANDHCYGSTNACIVKIHPWATCMHDLGIPWPMLPGRLLAWQWANPKHLKNGNSSEIRQPQGLNPWIMTRITRSKVFCITCLYHVKGRSMGPGMWNAMLTKNHRKPSRISGCTSHGPCIATCAKCSILIVQTPYLGFTTTCLRVNPIIASDHAAIPLSRG